MRLKLLPLIAFLLPAHARADEPVSFQVVDHGDAVEVIAHNLSMKSGSIYPIRSRLEVPLTGAPMASRQFVGFWLPPHAASAIASAANVLMARPSPG
jgi:hypothetical protein